MPALPPRPLLTKEGKFVFYLPNAHCLLWLDLAFLKDPGIMRRPLRLYGGHFTSCLHSTQGLRTYESTDDHRRHDRQRDGVV